MLAWTGLSDDEEDLYPVEAATAYWITCRDCGKHVLSPYVNTVFCGVACARKWGAFADLPQPVTRWHYCAFCGRQKDTHTFHSYCSRKCQQRAGLTISRMLATGCDYYGGYAHHGNRETDTAAD